MRILLFVFLFVVTFSLTGCNDSTRGRTEIEDMTFIRIIGIDKAPQTNQVRLTVLSKYSMPQKQSSAQKRENLISINGETIFDAIRKLSIYSNQRPFWGHCEFILLGEELAKDGVVKYLNFFTNQYQFRLSDRMFIVKDDTAENAIKKVDIAEKFFSDKLDLLIKNISNISVSDDIFFHDILAMFDRPYCSAYMPCISLESVVESDEEGAKKEDITMNGFAVFRSEKMIGYIKDDQAKGLNFARDNYKSGIIVVRDERGGKVSLEVLRADTKVIPYIDSNGKTTVTIQVKLSSNIGEIYSDFDIFNERNFRLMEKQQNEIVKFQIESVIKYAQKNKADFLDIWNKVYHKYPKQWEYLRDNWSETFSSIGFNIEVESKIVRSHFIKQPIKGLEVK